MTNILFEEKMKELIAYAKLHNERSPFAAMIFHEESKEEICRGINMGSLNPTLHGEIVAINNYIKLGSFNKLECNFLTIITTAEPCPMCLGAIIYTGFKRVVYGTSIKTLMSKGWNQIDISSEELTARANFFSPEIVPDVLKKETDTLFIDFRA